MESKMYSYLESVLNVQPEELLKVDLVAKDVR